MNAMTCPRAACRSLNVERVERPDLGRRVIVFACLSCGNKSLPHRDRTPRKRTAHRVKAAPVDPWWARG